MIIYPTTEWKTNVEQKITQYYEQRKETTTNPAKRKQKKHTLEDMSIEEN